MITRFRSVWRDALALLLAAGDRRTPGGSRLIALLALVYAASPVDLIPDVLPVLGVTDDLLVVPAILAFAARTLPAPVLAESRERVNRLRRRLPWLLPFVVAGFVLIVCLIGYAFWNALQQGHA
ncbi:YkvA family protein [Deinococcus maricopensis]|uniref:DUF1232 domain-containing protein n=1 Tax=Deinococcus maricopensis (strain DSM 21211 / LMG 22137 / NRRL B-23946 / LB-34) TaxID=709986 RepID=E8U4L3_DEIML|nr:DUF1232 domain-containing protein [Deinococcus maricopensis]ADV68878.1 protein of unknown function DUF1232 [Deinococcus maricopensis DSM 21211]